jgi:hypothetical protein
MWEHPCCGNAQVGGMQQSMTLVAALLHTKQRQQPTQEQRAPHVIGSGCARLPAWLTVHQPQTADHLRHAQVPCDRPAPTAGGESRRPPTRWCAGSNLLSSKGRVGTYARRLNPSKPNHYTHTATNPVETRHYLVRGAALCQQTTLPRADRPKPALQTSGLRAHGAVLPQTHSKDSVQGVQHGPLGVGVHDHQLTPQPSSMGKKMERRFGSRRHEVVDCTTLPILTRQRQGTRSDDVARRRRWLSKQPTLSS